jgi:hypothetical protein
MESCCKLGATTTDFYLGSIDIFVNRENAFGGFPFCCCVWTVLVIDVAALRYEAPGSMLDERGRRRFALAEALAAGWGAIAAVCEATGIARSTIDCRCGNCAAKRRIEHLAASAARAGAASP